MGGPVGFAPLYLSNSASTATAGGNTAFTGNNTHAGTETFNGPVLNGYTAVDTYSATQTTDMNAGDLQTLALAGPVTSWATLNRTAGRRVALLIKAAIDAVFTRASTAYDPYTGVAYGAGVARYPQPQNNLVKDVGFGFSPIYWGPTNCTCTGGFIGADGVTPNASKLTPNATTGTHYTVQTGLATTGVAGCSSVDAKANGFGFLIIELGSGVAWFNLNTGVVGTLSAATATMRPVGNGFYRCTVSPTTTASNTQTVFHAVNADGVSNPTGNGMDGILISRPQVENNASPTAYNAVGGPAVTQGTTNLLTSAQSQGTGGWATGGYVNAATVTNGDTTRAWEGPSSSKVVTAGSLVAEGSGATGSSATANLKYTASIWFLGTAGLSYIFNCFDNINGVNGGSFPNPSFTATGSWQRVTNVITMGVANSTNIGMYVYTNGTFASTFWVDGAQLEQQSAVTPWILGGTSRDTATLPMYPGFYNGCGLMVEEGVTNIIPAGQDDFHYTAGAANLTWANSTGSVPTVTTGRTDPNGGTGATRIQTTGGTFAEKYNFIYATGSPQTSYSLWARSNTGTVSFYSNLNPTGMTITAAMGWTKVVVPYTGTNTQNYLYIATSGAGVNLDVDLFRPLLSTKSYDVSWMPGGTTRAAETETIPASVMNPAAWTVDIAAYWSGDKCLATCLGAYCLFNHSVNTAINNTYIQRGGTQVVFVVADAGGVAQSLSWTCGAIAPGLHIMSIRSNGSEIAIFFDGVKVATAVQTHQVGSFTQPMAIGAYYNAPYVQQWNDPIKYVAVTKAWLDDPTMSANGNMHDPSVTARKQAAADYFIDYSANGGNQAPARNILLNPAWRVVGPATRPTQIPSGKVMQINLTATGPNESDIYAAVLPEAI